MRGANNLYIGLVHYPVYNKRREVSATAVTNLDIHDLARCAKTFDLGGFFIITPLESQIQLVERMIRYWLEGEGATYNPTRKEAFSLIQVFRSLEEAEQKIYFLWKKRPKRIATGASPPPHPLSFLEAKKLLEDGKTPFFLLFGTGWGLTEEVKDQSDYILAPIEGKGYNHLSIRTAAAIILDRLLSERLEKKGEEDGSNRDS
ncbi:MAG: RNA methyltransferase [Thermodesulfobacteriota bacterium]